MKEAQRSDTQQPITASKTAPKKAVCPHCGGLVTLRRRRCMDGNYSYYWRHQDNRNRACDGRSRPSSP